VAILNKRPMRSSSRRSDFGCKEVLKTRGHRPFSPQAQKSVAGLPLFTIAAAPFTNGTAPRLIKPRW
jgi:hypothetical protein